MSSYHEHSAPADSIDFIMQRISVILLEKQSVSFDKLRRLTLLGSSRTNSEEYCEIIVLSLIKHLDLDKSFKEEIKDHRNSYRLFNALNLNDDKINSFFVEFIAVIAPDIFTALSAVLAQLTLQLAERNSSRFTRERISRLQSGINNLIEDDKLQANEEVEEQEVVVEHQPKANKKQRKLSISDWIVGPASQSRRVKSNPSKSNSSGKTKSPNVVIEKKQKQRDSLVIGVRGIHLGSDSSSVSETASQTTERLKKQRQRERKEIPDVDDDPLPSKSSIRNAGAVNKYLVDDDESSVVF